MTRVRHRVSDVPQVRPSTFREFWPIYVRAHSKKGTRIMHAIGSTAALVCLALAVFESPWWLLAGIFIGYGFAWSSHFGIERNRPATFGHPFWSLAADYRMLALTLIGRMSDEVQRARASSSADTD